MRKPIIAGNWKMHKTIRESLELVNGLTRELTGVTDRAEVVVCPPFTALTVAADALLDSGIGLGAQNLFWEKQGAFTGEVSAAMLVDAGCQYVIIGHSERRGLFGETNEGVNRKLKAALAVKLIPIVCVGETLMEREKNLTFTVVEEQLVKGLAGIGAEEMKRTVIAYEPVWAIGTGRTATPKQAEEVHAFIRTRLARIFDDAVAGTVRIQYGGSVKPDNIAELMNEEDIDGALVGGASLTIESFSAIVRGAIA